MNEGLKEIGKGLINLANLMFVLFLVNNYMQKEDFTIIGIFAILYGVFMSYYYGYLLINKGNKNG